MMKPRHKVSKEGKQTRVHADELPDAIIALITEGVTQSKQIAVRVNWSVRAVVTRLQLLQDLGEIHRTAAHCNIGGLHYNWYLGPNPDGRSDDDTDRRVKLKFSGDPIIVRSKSYPVIGLRDPLVAALFGSSAAANEQISVGAA